MTEKKVKSRKEHICDVCDSVIHKGCYYIHGKDRAPNYDDNDDQIGIEYIEWKICSNCSGELIEDKITTNET